MKLFVVGLGVAIILFVGGLFARYYALNEYIRGYSDAKLAGSSSSADWDTLWGLVNNYKTSNGLPALKKDDKLCDLANKRSEEVVNSWSHDSFLLSGNLKYDVYCPTCTRLSENLAKDYNTPEEVMAGWIASATHKAILDKSYTKGCLGYTIKNGSVFISLISGI